MHKNCQYLVLTVIQALYTHYRANPYRDAAGEQMEVKGAQSCLTFCNPWTVAQQASLSMGFSRGSSQPRDQTQVSCIAGRFFNQLSYQRSPLRLRKKPQEEWHFKVLWFPSYGNSHNPATHDILSVCINVPKETTSRVPVYSSGPSLHVRLDKQAFCMLVYLDRILLRNMSQILILFSI